MKLNVGGGAHRMGVQPRDPEGRTFLQEAAVIVKHILMAAVLGYVLMLADVWGVMMRSKKLNDNCLMISYACYGLFACIGFYLSFIVSRTNPNWENTHMEYIYVATGALTGGAIFWTIALWPVFHMWTIPLGLCASFFLLTLLTLVPGPKRKLE